MQALPGLGFQAFEAAVEFVESRVAAHGLPEFEGLHVGGGAGFRVFCMARRKASSMQKS
ncbi:hypothetical protein D3C84_1227890 [compost metagenome]